MEIHKNGLGLMSNAGSSATSKEKVVFIEISLHLIKF